MPRSYLKDMSCESCHSSYQTKRRFKTKNGKYLCPKCRTKEARARAKEAQGAAFNKRTEKTKKRDKERNLLRNYGITQIEYDRLFEQQGGLCAICKRTAVSDSIGRRLAVDHDHQTGKVRGLLCGLCNRAIGAFKDNLTDVRAACSYLMRADKKRDWDWYFLDVAELVSTRSKDPSTQVGSVITIDNAIISTGYNGFARGINDNIPERYLRPLKYKLTIHAESNAILNAARHGLKIQSGTLYSTLLPCASCALAIINCGIKEVVYNPTSGSVGYTESCNDALDIFNSAKLLVRTPDK